MAKRSQLEEGLCHELKNDPIARDEPELFADLVTLLQKLDQKRRCLTALAQGRKAASTTQTASATHTHTPHAHTSAGAHAYSHLYIHHIHYTTATKTPTTATMASGIHAGPIDLSAGRKKLMPGGRAPWLAEGRCLYYGGVGHMAGNCLNAHRHPLRAAEGALVPRNHDPTAAAAAAENAAH